MWGRLVRFVHDEELVIHLPSYLLVLKASVKSRDDIDITALFDRNAGTMDPRIYFNREVYDLEMEKIFTRSWLFLGHEGQFPKFGDYLVTTMAEDSVIVCCCAPRVDQLCALAVDQEREQAILRIFENCAILAPIKLARADWR